MSDKPEGSGAPPLATPEWPWPDGSCPLCHGDDQPRTELRVFWKYEYIGDACAGCVANLRRLPDEPRAAPFEPLADLPEKEK